LLVKDDREDSWILASIMGYLKDMWQKVQIAAALRLLRGWMRPVLNQIEGADGSILRWLALQLKQDQRHTVSVLEMHTAACVR
jgi:hypothetical protein